MKVRMLAACLALAVCCALVPAVAGAVVRSPGPPVTPTSPVTRGSAYLALGDSVTFGYQEPTVIPRPDYRVAASFIGYPEVISAQLKVGVTNLACPGETSASLINASAPSNGCENAYRKLYPLHVRYSGSQLSAGLAFLRRTPRTRLVSLMIGANDLFLCEKQTKDGCLARSEQQALFARVASNVRRILSAVRNQAHYRGQIAIVTYYSSNYTSALISGVISGLNAAVVGAARPFTVVVADGFHEFRYASWRFRLQPCLAGLITQLHGVVGQCGVHPTYSGQVLLATALLKAIRL